MLVPESVTDKVGWLVWDTIELASTRPASRRKKELSLLAVTVRSYEPLLSFSTDQVLLMTLLAGTAQVHVPSARYALVIVKVTAEAVKFCKARAMPPALGSKLETTSS